MATKAFAYTAQYDAIIADYLQTEFFPAKLTLSFDKVTALRYGENPHQQASVYRRSGCEHGLLSAKQHQGKQLSFNNLFDADAALRCATEFTQPTCVIVKHANPCGVAEANNIDVAFMSAWLADSKSAFGGVVVLNRSCTVAIAENLCKVFVEIIVAPSYETAALAVLKNKPNLRVLEIADLDKIDKQKYTFKPLLDGILVQDANDHHLLEHELKCLTQKHPTPEVIRKLLVAKYAKSNAIVIAGNNIDGALTTLGLGQGQVSRVDAMEIALCKAGNKLDGAVVASDGFFPFRDSVDLLANTGVHAIIQPGGSLRDNEVIAACDELGIAMVFSGVRNFHH